MSKQNELKNSAPMPYFSMIRNGEEQTAEVYIFGDIAHNRGGLAGLFQANSDQSSYDLANQIAGIPEDWAITVHINSNGGELKEGLGIYNVLKARDVTTVCEGFAASAGSVIFAAGKRRIMQPASLLFIHQASMGAEGNADDFAKLSGDLKVITDSAVAAYRESGINIEAEELYNMLKAETWITPEDAVRMGFATEIMEVDAEEEGVVYNDAMNSIMAAVTQKPKSAGTIEVGIDAEPLLKALKEINAQMEKYTDLFALAEKAMAAVEKEPELLSKFAAMVNNLTTKPTPNPAPVEHRGFFNFKKPENGKGGSK